MGMSVRWGMTSMTLAFGHVANRLTSCAPWGVMVNRRGAASAASWWQAVEGTSA